MKQINPIWKWTIGNLIGFACLLLTASNVTYHWFNIWYSIIGYVVCLFIFGYTLFFLSPRMKRYLDYQIENILPGGEKK